MNGMITKMYDLFQLNSLKRRMRFWFIFLILLFVILSFFSLALYGRKLYEYDSQDHIQQLLSLQHFIIEIFTLPFIIVVLLGIIITFWLSNQVENTIYKVLEGAKSISKAKFGYRIDPTSYLHEPIELQELCKTFNRMAEMIESNLLSVQKSEERYRSLIELSPNAIVVHQDSKIVYANPAFIRLIKADSLNDFLGQNIIKFIHPDFQEIVKERMYLLERNTPVGLLDEKYVMMDGSIIDVQVIATPIEYMNKPAFQVIIQDITDRKIMEKELQASQEKYRLVVENVKEVIFQTDIQGRWTLINPAWQEITGYTIEESIGNTLFDYIHPDDLEQNLHTFQALIEGKNEYCHLETRYLTKSRGLRWVEVNAKITLGEQGQIIGTSGTLDDITKRKNAEEQLRASEERFRLIAESSSDMITMHDENGYYLYASPACKELLYYSEEELVGIDSYSLIHPDDIKTIQNNHKALLEIGSTVCTYRIRRKDGQYLWFESSVKLLPRTYSNDTKWIVVSRNINERKLAEEKLEQANAMLHRLSTIDGLTGVANRRAFDARLEIEWNHCNLIAKPLSLIMLDIDYFKPYNDVYGHLGGDECLKAVASAIQHTLERSTDFFCRYGGEEFSVILPETDKNGANKVAEKIRTAIEALQIPHQESSISQWVTVSVGSATIIPNLNSSPTDLISYADKAVYQAKKDGRNCVRNYESLFETYC
ncbi:PAS domain S-box protein [Calidifontibacillus oryziterrae]|uniref:PAS domain S-box protein n=1 Tax=Calidifontibacillus oryziterrae TaxID=1191699 RepID=UPI00035D0568|nr:PAS domain S-box protein [Calidifontibacillus oryziterrae]